MDPHKILIKFEKNIENCPLITEGEEIVSGIHVHCIKESDSLQDFLKTLYGSDGPYTMDDSLYMQLFMSDWENHKNILVLYNYHKKSGLRGILNAKGNEFGLLSPFNQLGREVVMELPFSGAVRWLKRLGENQYFGIAETPKIMSLEEWSIECCKTLQEHFQNISDFDDTFIQLEISQIKLLFSLGYLNEWKFVNNNFVETVVIDTSDFQESHSEFLSKSYESPKRTPGWEFMFVESITNSEIIKCDISTKSHISISAEY
jgi:hypothetical protein